MLGLICVVLVPLIFVLFIFIYIFYYRNTIYNVFIHIYTHRMYLFVYNAYSKFAYNIKIIIMYI